MEPDSGNSRSYPLGDRAKILGDNIERARKLRGMSRQQLADELAVSEQTLGRYVLGKREPSLTKIFKIARVLGVSINSLTGDAEVTDVFEYRLARAKELVYSACGQITVLGDGTYIADVPDNEGLCVVVSPDAAVFVDTFEKILLRAVSRDQTFAAALIEYTKAAEAANKI